ncbi:hypothetical protein CSE45_2552 [Citreicella sp. SE45]|nr:hypothetical protein CSE45_2552 [Citreicella sp. SE45]
MAVILQATEFAVPDAEALKMRGMQTDPYNEVKGGHAAILNFLDATAGALAVSDEIANTVHGGDPATALTAWATGISAADKGLSFDAAAGVAERLQLPGAFDLATLGAEPSFVLSTWVTLPVGFGAVTPPNSIMGFAYQSGAEAQWFLSGHGGTTNLRFAISSEESNTNQVLFDATPYLGAPMLMSAVVTRIGAGSFRLDFYRGTTRIGGAPSLTYGFNAPVTGAPVPVIGGLGGFGDDFTGTVHRLQLFRFDPDSFDVADWLEAEVAAMEVVLAG